MFIDHDVPRICLAVFFILVAILMPILLTNSYPNDTCFTFDDIVQQRLRQTSDSPLNIVVTGSNSGLGYGTVYHMAKLPNVNIIMACRSIERCEKAKKIIPIHHNSTRLTCLALDLSSQASVQSFAQTVQYHLTPSGKGENSTHPPIHIMVNNAGMFGASKSLEYIDGIEAHVQVNHLGHFLLTHLLWKNLMAVKHSRIVSVSSLVTILPVDATAQWYHPITNQGGWRFFTSHFWDNVACYVRSKRANLMFAVELHHHGIPTSVTSHPGYTRSSLMVNGMQFMPSWFRRLLQINTFGSMSVLEGAWTQVRAALDPNISSGMHVGPKFWTVGEPVVVGNIIAEEQTTTTSHHWPFSREQSRRLWDQSMNVLGIQEFGKR